MTHDDLLPCGHPDACLRCGDCGWCETEQERDALAAHVGRLREALDRYGDHDDDRDYGPECMALRSGPETCDCGYDAALASTPAASLEARDAAGAEIIIVHLLDRATDAARLDDDEQEERAVRAARSVLAVVTDADRGTEAVARMESLWDRAEALRARIDREVAARTLEDACLMEEAAGKLCVYAAGRCNSGRCPCQPFRVRAAALREGRS